MLEKALRGDRHYWTWVAALLAVMAVGATCYLWQLREGLAITGLSRDVTWGFYIAQFTFLVGVAASAVMVVLPYYLHDFKAFGRITVLGEFLAIAAVTMCLLFVVVDLGQPGRAFNMLLHPSPRSILFWDMVVLNGYLVLNVVITRVSLTAERRGEAPPPWVKPVILLSIPWAIGIHTVTAFIYSGLGARPFWMTAILAPRFLASAFASGPALLILLCLALGRFTRFRAGEAPVRALSVIVTYALLANLFFVLMEAFTAFYSGIPEHAAHFRFLFFGLEGNSSLAPFMWVAEILALGALVVLLVPSLKNRQGLLAAAATAVIVSVWIEKGLGMVVTGFIPTPLGHIASYTPTLPELGVSAGIYALGALLVTGFYKIALSVRGEGAR
ncbi:MAG TPA: NrfD/PsrC family molybdoenzyme membrane anchor subunit [Vicinamibacterales bacterium]|nr:NrfD/PsrC family molybdoenzyme membrane anchor subunit [Vicinamibacterales bacterium]